MVAGACLLRVPTRYATVRPTCAVDWRTILPCYSKKAAPKRAPLLAVLSQKGQTLDRRVVMVMLQATAHHLGRGGGRWDSTPNARN